MSCERLVVTELQNLVSSVKDFSNQQLNPFNRPPFASSVFGEFPVESVSAEA
jgi:hypothetical protein